ncbi:MAG: hypothetical protein IKQ92_01780 [Clostridia bacterium]|nr:hypothetical protein [Clostridia bacterium]
MKKLLVLLLILTLLPVPVMADVLPDPSWYEPPVEIGPEPDEGDVAIELDEIPADDADEAQTTSETDTAGEGETAEQNTSPNTRDYTAPIVAAAVAVAVIAAAVLIYTIRTKKSKEA